MGTSSIHGELTKLPCLIPGLFFPYKAKPGFIAIFMTHDVIPDKNLWKKSDQIVISAEIWNVEDMVKTSLNDYTSIRVKDPEEIVAKHGSL